MPSRDDSLFFPASFFLVRAPLFPMEIFFKLVQAQDVSHFLLALFQSRADLREAICVASSSLYEALSEFIFSKSPSSKERESLTSSLLKYVLRMATRATPFGLFSFVSLGKWGDSSVTFRKEDIKKRGRPDMEWLMQFLDQLSENAAFDFSVARNPLLYESMGRIFLPFSRKKRNKEELFSICATPLVRLILEKSEKSISREALIREITALSPSLDSQKISEMICSLLKEEFLSPSFFPTLLSESPLQDIFRFINWEASESLREINSMIASYNATLIGEGEILLQTIKEEMSKHVSSSSSFLQVDAVCEKEVSLPLVVALEAGQAAEVLWKLSPKERGISYLRSYHKKFLEKYGLFRAVPLLELLDEDVGLGLPEHYLSPSLEMPEETPKWERWLSEEWMKCFYEGRSEIVLTDALIDQLGKGKDFCEAPLSFDLYCEVIASSEEEIGKGNFSIHLLAGGGDGCGTAGRFLDMLGEEGEKKISAFLREEEGSESNAIFVETSYFPRFPRGANVAIHKNLRQKVLDLGHSKERENALSLEDIFVSANEKRFFLTLKEGKKHLIMGAMNALNFLSAPIPVRLMRDVSKDGYQLLFPLSWGRLERLPYLPRVRYNKAILSAARWNLTLSLIGGSEIESLEGLIQKISQWAEKWRLPHYLLMSIADHRILLDRRCFSHLKEIALQLKKHPERPVVLVEKLGAEEWVKSCEGMHRAEFVIPFVKNKKYAASTPFQPAYAFVPPSLRWKIPGSEWLYAKIYLSSSNEARFLAYSLASFAEKIRGGVEKWFFVRYREEGASHIRIRWKTQGWEEYERLFKQFHVWANSFIQEGWIKEVVLASYEREVERYGGEKGLECAETFFQADSESVLALLKAQLSKQILLPNYVAIALSAIDLLKEFRFSLAQQLHFFSQMELKNELLEGFREWKSKLVASAYEVWNGSPSSEEIRLLFSIFQMRKKDQETYFQEMQTAEKKDPWLWTSLVQSLLHMHCNRILGVDNSLEQKAYLYALHTIKVLANKFPSMSIHKTEVGSGKEPSHRQKDGVDLEVAGPQAR